VDARWNSTEVGRFLSAVLPLPNGTVAKGLAIRVGAGGEATVAYDMATASCRASWPGFLKFDGVRYGLMGAPKPAGEMSFVSANDSLWSAPVRWRGLHVNGPRVVLDYDVGATRVLETPWCQTNGGFLSFTRDFDIAAGGELKLPIFTAKDILIRPFDGQLIARAKTKQGDVAVAARGAALRIGPQGGMLLLEVPASTSARRVELFIARTEPANLAQMLKRVESSPLVESLAKPGPPNWQPLTTRGQRGVGSGAFIIDTLTVPYQNPWKALFFTAGVDFLPNGDAAVCTIHGDVWLVSGIDEKLEKLTWRRFATGLHQPLGLRVRDGKVFVLGRDQITRLHDQNGDGEADFYENFHSGIATSKGGHDYVTSLDMDAKGNFYYVDPIGVHRVNADGARSETIARGWRNPNGMGVSADGSIVLVAPQQGEWTPSSAISEARSGGWYGYRGPKVTPDRPLGYDPHLCWVPHSADNSGGSQLWVTSEKWGSLRDRFIHFSYGRCSQFLVLREVVDGVAQGAITPLPGKFLSGAMRGAFNPRDGQLYVVGSQGWQTSAARDGCLQRVRYSGADPLLPVGMHVHSNGLRITFTAPLDRAAAEDAGSYSYSDWNYRYSGNYGSKDYSPSAPDKEGHDTLTVKSARLLADGKTVFLEIPELRPVMQFEVKYSLNSADGQPMRSTIWGTINRMRPTFSH
jgi:glucose/arabinose dehydrogenase